MMDPYIIRREFLVWQEVEVFADSEEEAIKIVNENWAELGPVDVSHYQFTGHTQIKLPE